jgi:hypothetical protein
VVVSGLVFANREVSKKNASKSSSATDKKSPAKKWEETPDGIMFKKWEASEAGKRVFAAEAKIRNSIRNYSNMQGQVTSLTLPSGSRVGLGVMVRINDEDFIVSFGVQKPGSKDFEQLKSLKVNDKIILKSHGVSHAPKYLYPIVSADYVERDNKIIYKRAPQKGGC